MENCVNLINYSFKFVLKNMCLLVLWKLVLLENGTRVAVIFSVVVLVVVYPDVGDISLPAKTEERKHWSWQVLHLYQKTCSQINRGVFYFSLIKLSLTMENTLLFWRSLYSCDLWWKLKRKLPGSPVWELCFLYSPNQQNPLSKFHFLLIWKCPFMSRTIQSELLLFFPWNNVSSHHVVLWWWSQLMVSHE